MARNGSGTFNLVTNTWFPPVNGVTATSVDWATFISDIASALTQSVSKDGQTTMTGNLPMGGFKLTGLAAGTATGNSLRWEQLFSQGAPATVASAATTDIGVQNSVAVEITGTITITSFGTNYNGPRFLRFTDALILTHSASLNLPGAANITTVAGDTCIAYPNSAGTGWNVVQFQRAAALPATAGAITTSGLTQITARILGRTTASTGAIEELTAGAALSLAAGSLNVADAGITAPKLSGAQTGSAPIYGARAWVNFNGTGTVAIRASGNVSSITDNGVGDYTVNFTTALPNANYSMVSSCSWTTGQEGYVVSEQTATARTTTAIRIVVGVPGTAGGSALTAADLATVSLAFFG